MSTTALSTLAFAYNDAPVRIVIIDDNPWWVAADLAELLGYRRAPDMVRLLKPHQKGVHKVHTPGGEQSLTVVTEGGLFKCILRSTKPEAEKFELWVTDVVLPQLRKTGRYETLDAEGGDAFALAGSSAFEQRRLDIAMVNAARNTYGQKGAERAWELSGLPDLRLNEIRLSGPPLPMMSPAHQSIADWMEARCQSAPGYRLSTMTLYEDYEHWMVAQGRSRNERHSVKAFSLFLTSCGIGSMRSNVVYRIGLKLKEQGDV